MAGLCLPLPGADHFLNAWRSKHDWTRAGGLPAHVTVHMPFPATLRLDPSVVRAEFADLFPISITLARLEERPGALVAAVEPDGALRELTKGITSLDPACPPHHQGADFGYHVTVVRTPDDDVRTRAASAVRSRLPHVELADDVWRFEWEGLDLEVISRSSADRPYSRLQRPPGR